jgi:hypothetical protein
MAALKSGNIGFFTVPATLRWGIFYGPGTPRVIGTVPDRPRPRRVADRR